MVIISGVMVWLKAREKNKKYLLKSKFNTNVGAIYLGSCLGLYPAIALMFILTKTFSSDMMHRFDWISWLFLLFGWAIRSMSTSLKTTLRSISMPLSWQVPWAYLFPYSTASTPACGSGSRYPWGTRIASL